MKDLFPGYYHNPDFKKLFKECIFVFDSNVLLSVYELPKKDTENLFNALENDKIHDKLWIPHQVALEYQRNRWYSIRKQNNAINIKKGLNGIAKSITDLDDNLKELSMLQQEYIDADSLSEEVQKLLHIIRGLKEHKEPNLLINDTIRDKIDELFENKIGTEYSKEKLQEIYEEGEERFKNKIPPGFEDENKENIKRFGDLVLWKQTIEYADLIKKPVVFITNEKKRDWWFKNDENQFLGPQAELINEFLAETGQLFHMYRLPEFLKHITKYLQIDVEETTVHRIENIVDRENWGDDSKFIKMTLDNIKPDEFIPIEKYSDIKSYLIGIDTIMAVIDELSDKFEGLVPIPLLYNEMLKRYGALEETTYVLIERLKKHKMIIQLPGGYMAVNKIK